MSRKILKIIDYHFQHKFQLVDCYDDSNSMRYLSNDLEIYVIGRFNCSAPAFHPVKGDNYNYSVIFFPADWDLDLFLKHVMEMNPDVIHMHGTHTWSRYLYYADRFRKELNCKMIFSGAGPSTGTPEFLANFDKVIVNHPIQVERMKCEREKVIVRKRSADPKMFYPIDSKKEYDFIMVSGFIPGKRIDIMIDYVAQTSHNIRGFY